MHRRAVEALLPDRAVAAVRFGEVAGVAFGGRAHEARRAAFARRRDEQVHVVPHQRVGVHRAGAACGTLAQPFEVGEAVARAGKAGRERALHDVQGDAGFFGTRKAHDVRRTPRSCVPLT